MHPLTSPPVALKKDVVIRGMRIGVCDGPLWLLLMAVEGSSGGRRRRKARKDVTTAVCWSANARSRVSLVWITKSRTQAASKRCWRTTPQLLTLIPPLKDSSRLSPAPFYLCTGRVGPCGCSIMPHIFCPSFAQLPAQGGGFLPNGLFSCSRSCQIVSTSRTPR